MTSVSPDVARAAASTRTEQQVRDERAKQQQANIDRLERKRNDPLYFDDGLGDVWTASDFERSMRP